MSKKAKHTPIFEIGYCKPPTIDLANLESSYYSGNPTDIEHEYNPFSIQKMQRYQPIFSMFFEMNETNYDKIQYISVPI
jgi:hypothetical protein